MIVLIIIIVIIIIDILLLSTKTGHDTRGQRKILLPRKIIESIDIYVVSSLP